MKETIGEDTSLNYMVDRYEKVSSRYIEAERFIWELADLKWYQKLFIRKKVIKFISGQIEKYNF